VRGKGIFGIITPIYGSIRVFLRSGLFHSGKVRGARPLSAITEKRINPQRSVDQPHPYMLLLGSAKANKREPKSYLDFSCKFGLGDMHVLVYADAHSHLELKTYLVSCHDISSFK
jgi:hypothetical protein